MAWEFHLGDREWEEAWRSAWCSQNDIIINSEIPVHQCIPHKLAFDLRKILICFLSLRMLASD